MDYPPLTAFHEWLMGSIVQRIYPEMIALHTSRGFETDTSVVGFVANSFK